MAQTYVAKSILMSSTLWVNLLTITMTILEAEDVTNVLPPGALKYVPVALAIINIILRTFTVRPVALIPPSQTKRVQVESLTITQ